MIQRYFSAKQYQFDSTAYRDELDGIRAIAILAVLMFHVGFADWQGGFIGVDVFFVLSGYLICGQIYSSLQAENFSALSFFARRIRRLSTAFFVCFLFTGIAAIILASGSELLTIAKNLLASTFFANNILQLNTVGYFDPLSKENPFLHTWSLGIEEQFYILIPIVVLLTSKNAIRFVLFLGLIFFVSLFATFFAGNIYTPSQRFFATELRLWELAIGGLTFILMSKAKAIKQWPFLPFLGLLMIVVPIFSLTETELWPGFATLLPVLGTVLLLLFCNENRPGVSWFLSTKFMRYIGRVSYGTYLWHWPIIAYFTYLGITLGDEIKAAIVIGSIGLGAISHHFIEMPVRRISISKYRAKLFLMFAVQTGILIALYSAMVWFANNSETDDAEIAKIQEQSILHANWDQCWAEETEIIKCRFGAAEGDPDFLVWGDSIANSAYPIFEKFAAETKQNGVLVTSPGCLPSFNLKRGGTENEETCRLGNLKAAEMISQGDIDTVFILGRWSFYAEGYAKSGEVERDVIPLVSVETGNAFVPSFDAFAKDFATTLETIGSDAQLVVFNQAPVYQIPIPRGMKNAKRLGREFEKKSRIEFDNRDGRTAQAIERISTSMGATQYNIFELFCDETTCNHEIDGYPLLADTVHYSNYLNTMIYDKFLANN